MYSKEMSRQNKEILEFGLGIIGRCFSAGELYELIKTKYPDLTSQRLNSRTAKIIRIARGRRLISW